MRYTVTSEFTTLNEKSGLIQNTSNIYTLEVSPVKTKDSGVLVYPLNSVSFSGSPVYVRCVDGGIIDLRVADLNFDSSTADDNPNTVIIDGVQYTVESDTGMNSSIDDAFNGNSVPTDNNFDSDLDNIFSGGGGSSSSGDADFDSALDNIFNP